MVVVFYEVEVDLFFEKVNVADADKDRVAQFVAASVTASDNLIVVPNFISTPAWSIDTAVGAEA